VRERTHAARGFCQRPLLPPSRNLVERLRRSRETACMKRYCRPAGLLFSLLLTVTSLPAQDVPAAVIADSAPDATHPATMVVAAIQSGDATMNGVLYVASGAGPHPTLLLLHGLPGNEQNLDLAQAVRRAGWNVLTMHYRGSWGSGGAFSFTHAFEDVHSALAWLRVPANAAKGRVDTGRLAVAGHSFGGVLAAHAAATDRAVIGTAMISAWNLGAFAAAAKARGDEGRAAFERSMADNRESLAGCTPASLCDDAFANAAAWNFRDRAQALADRPLLLVSSRDGNGPESQALGKLVRAAGGKAVTEQAFPTDHSFNDHRIALAGALVRWLDTISAAAK